MIISNGQQKTDESDNNGGKNVSNTGTQTQYEPFEKFNWYIYLQYVQGDIDTCKKLIKKEVERCGGYNDFILYTQGAIHRKEGKMQEALDSFQAYLKINPGNAECLKEVAKCLYEMRRYKLAVEAFSEAEEQFNKNPDWEVFYYLGQCFMKLGDLDKAKDYANKAVKTGKHEMCYAFLVKLLTNEEKLSSAVDVSNVAVEFYPDSVQMLTECGILHLKLGQIQEAVEKLRSALSLDPTCKRALLAIGYITQKHGEYDASLAKYKIAIQVDPDSIALWNNIGLCFYLNQKFVAAISCLKRSLWLHPLNWKTLYNASLAYLSTLQPASAFNFACASVNLRPDVSDSFTLLAAALLELGDPENAAQAILRAVQLAPSDGLTVLNTSLCCQQAGMIEDAINYFKKFQEIIEEDREPLWFTSEVQHAANGLALKLKDHEMFSNGKDILIARNEVINNAENKISERHVEEVLQKQRTLEEDEV